MIRMIRKIANSLGIDIIKLEKATSSDNPYCQYSKVKNNIIDVEMLGAMSLTIPGMITSEAGKFLYSLCYMQDLEGDVVEIGSWQGRSSIFLASVRNGRITLSLIQKFLSKMKLKYRYDILSKRCLYSWCNKK